MRPARAPASDRPRARRRTTGLPDELRSGLVPAGDKVPDLADQHGDTIRPGPGKTARVGGGKTGGEYGDRIRTGTGQAQDAVFRLAHRDERGATPPPDKAPAPPPAS
ncbi:Rv0909 family putative TA system antitoxin [Streptomyces sp. NPDC005551]|uniref:Rv0909 family putative TA system antitoxin n=1 Tax=unclassified Streptomyces TaxID=2593676 RepID=UPI0033DD5374